MATETRRSQGGGEAGGGAGTWLWRLLSDMAKSHRGGGGKGWREGNPVRGRGDGRGSATSSSSDSMKDRTRTLQGVGKSKSISGRRVVDNMEQPPQRWHSAGASAQRAAGAAAAKGAGAPVKGMRGSGGAGANSTTCRSTSYPQARFTAPRVPAPPSFLSGGNRASSKGSKGLVVDLRAMEAAALALKLVSEPDVPPREDDAVSATDEAADDRSVSEASMNETDETGSDCGPAAAAPPPAVEDEHASLNEDDEALTCTDGGGSFACGGSSVAMQSCVDRTGSDVVLCGGGGSSGGLSRDGDPAAAAAVAAAVASPLMEEVPAVSAMPAVTLKTCLSLTQCVENVHDHVEAAEEDEAMPLLAAHAGANVEDVQTDTEAGSSSGSDASDDDDDDDDTASVASSVTAPPEGPPQPVAPPPQKGGAAGAPVAPITELVDTLSTVWQGLTDDDLDKLENEWGDIVLTPAAAPAANPDPLAASTQDGWINVVINKTPLLRAAAAPPADDGAPTSGTGVDTHEIIGEGGEVWVNAIIRATWPYVSEHISSTLRRVIEPALGKAVTGALRLCAIELGSACPALGATSVVRLPDGSLRVDTHAMWDAECDITIDVGPGTSHVGMSAGVDSLKLNGELTLLLGPPCPTPPYFNALQVYFPNTPEVILRLTGLGMVASSLPGVTEAIHKAVSDALAAVAVLPNRVAVPINPTLTPLDAARYKCSAPMGVLHVKVRDLDVIGRSPTLFGWAEDTVPATAVSIAVGSTTHTIAIADNEGGGAPVDTDALAPLFLVYSEAQLVTVKALDDRGAVLASASARVAELCRTNEVKMEPEGAVSLECAWQPAGHDECGDAAADGDDDGYDTLKDTPVVAERALAAVSQERLRAALIAVELGSMDVMPPLEADNVAERWKLRVSHDGAVAFTSGVGTAKWAKGDQVARNELLLGTMHRAEEAGLSIDGVAAVLGIPVALVEEYRAVEAGGTQAWLDKVRGLHEARTALHAPHFAETTHCLLPVTADAITLELIAASTGVAHATFTAALPEAAGVVDGPFAFATVDGAVGTSVCSLTARITRSEVAFGKA